MVGEYGFALLAQRNLEILEDLQEKNAHFRIIINEPGIPARKEVDSNCANGAMKQAQPGMLFY